MPVIVCPAAPRVNPTPLPRAPLALLPVPPVAVDALDARLAAEPVFDAPTVGDAFEPTTGDRWAEIGYTLGRAGSLSTAAETFPDATPAELIDGSFWFHESVHAGYATYVRSIGRALGLDGRECERPLSIPARFAAEFIGGWESGDAERSERARLEAQWSAEYDAEMDERDWHESSAEALGWPSRPWLTSFA